MTSDTSVTGAKLLDRLFDAIGRHRDAYNRRPLYAAFDTILADLVSDGVSEIVETLRQQARSNALTADAEEKETGDAPVSAVRLRSVALRNWKLFESVDLELPSKLENDRDVLLIGGRNGHGKSSLLEACVFGLFGIRAVSELGHLAEVMTGRRSARRAYAAAMESALSRTVEAGSEAMMSVKLVFDVDDEPFTVDRHWYFDDLGNFLETEEELILRTGEDGDILAPPASVLPLSWGQDEIERRIMPTSLAPFFLLDGEKIDQWSQGQLSELVRTGLDRVLGLDRYAALAASLEGYSAERGRDLAGVATSFDAGLRQEIETLSERLIEAQKELETLPPFKKLWLI